MRFTNEMASQVGLAVGGKAGTALIHPVHGFEGRRIYIDGGVRAHGVRGPLIHLSGFTPEECELLGAMTNPKDEYSSRITGFLKLSPENLKNAAQVLLEATSPAHVPASRKLSGVDVGAIFQAVASSSVK